MNDDIAIMVTAICFYFLQVLRYVTFEHKRKKNAIWFEKVIFFSIIENSKIRIWKYLLKLKPYFHLTRSSFFYKKNNGLDVSTVLMDFRFKNVDYIMKIWDERREKIGIIQCGICSLLFQHALLIKRWLIGYHNSFIRLHFVFPFSVGCISKFEDPKVMLNQFEPNLGWW